MIHRTNDVIIEGCLTESSRVCEFVVEVSPVQNLLVREFFSLSLSLARWKSGSCRRGCITTRDENGPLFCIYKKTNDVCHDRTKEKFKVQKMVLVFL